MSFYVDADGNIAPPYSELKRPLTLDDTGGTAINVIPGDDAGVYLEIANEDGEAIVFLSAAALTKLIELLTQAKELT